MRDGWFDAMGIDILHNSVSKTETWRRYVADGKITSVEFEEQENIIKQKLIALEKTLDDVIHAEVGDVLLAFQTLVDMHKFAISLLAEEAGFSSPEKT